MERKEDIERWVLESPENVAQLLRGAAHPSRVVILGSLAVGEGDFSALVDKTKLSRTALVNHLNQLIEIGLVRRAFRGEYALTADGEALIMAAASIYRLSKRREEMLEEAARQSYVRPKGGSIMSRHIIASPAKYQPCWISYNGAMAGLISSQGTACDIVDVAGRSGYAFLMNVISEGLCASGPTALGLEAWVQIREGTEGLGYRLEHWTDFSARPDVGKPSVKELEKMKRLFDRVRNEIDAGRPAVVWGIAIPEYGLVNGYDGDSYIVSSFRSAIGIPDDPVLYHQLDAPGCYDAYFIKSGVPRQESDEQLLARALRFARGQVKGETGYVNGPRTFLSWADGLEKGTLNESSYMDNAYVGACYQESKELASAFLDRMAKRTGNEEVVAASAAYRASAVCLKRFTELFPFAPQGSIGEKERRAGSALLREAYELENTAVEAAARALEDI